METNYLPRTKSRLIPALLLTGSMLTATAHAGSISILGEDGQLFSLDTSTGLATAGTKYSDPPGSAEPQYSPNGLGIGGSDVFYTSFNVGVNIPDTLYRNGVALTTINTGNPFNIANGDVVGSNFNFVDRNSGDFFTVGNIFGNAGTQTVSRKTFGAADQYQTGDIAIDGDSGYISYANGSGAYLTKFNINSLATLTTVATPRFLGLGFDGSSLYGVRALGANFGLYSIDTGSLIESFIANISGIPTSGGAVTSRYEITDAARAIPEPELPLLSLIGGLGWMMVFRKRR